MILFQQIFQTIFEAIYEVHFYSLYQRALRFITKNHISYFFTPIIVVNVFNLFAEKFWREAAKHLRQILSIGQRRIWFAIQLLQWIYF